MVSTPSQPKPPNPNTTARTSAKYNLQAAQEQAKLNNVNQVTPQGSLTYVKNPDGSYTATTTLTPKGEQAFNQEQDFDIGSNQVAQNQLGVVGSTLSTPVDLSNNAVEGRLMDLGRTRLDPLFATQEDALDTKLRNQGLDPSDEAWKQAYIAQNQKENDAYNQLLLNAHQTGVSDIMAERNQPLTELNTLEGLGHVANPQYVNTPQEQVAPVNYSSIVGNNYLGQQNAYNQQMASNNALYGAIGGAAGAIGGAWLGKA